MTIPFQCPQCGKSFQVQDQLAGKRARCPCGASIAIPAAPPASDPFDDLELAVEVPVETVPAAARTRPSERELLAPHIEQKPVKKGSHAEKQKAPPWGWGFFAACLAIMIVTRGGAIWGALGGGVGGLCLKVAQAQSLPVPLRIVICTAVTAALWVGIVMLVLSLAG